MEYVHYHRDVVKKYDVELLNWPHHIFACPSSLGNSFPVLERILSALQNGDCKFERITPERVMELDVQYEADIAAGIKPGPKVRAIGSDTGMKKKRKGGEQSTVESDEDGQRPTKRKKVANAGSKEAGQERSKRVISDSE